ncbi:MAG: hypothetical protein EOM35_02265 [Negativicutes bacterium]|jgi:hypothetical protein|nr:hypothetical protein [Negativicutes bacterium]
MTSAYIIIAASIIMSALVATLFWLSYKYGKISVLKDQATANLTVRTEANNDKEKLKKLTDTELDNRLSKWMRDDK